MSRKNVAMSRAMKIVHQHATTILLLVLTLVYASEISSVRSLFDEGFVSTRFLPSLLVGVALVAIAVIALRDLRAASQVDDAPAQSLLQHVKPLGLFAVVLGYIALFRPLGFFATTFAFSLCCLWLFDYAAQQESLGRRLRANLVAAIAITGVAYLLFAVAFGARLPLLPELG